MDLVPVDDSIWYQTHYTIMIEKIDIDQWVSDINGLDI